MSTCNYCNQSACLFSSTQERLLKLGSNYIFFQLKAKFQKKCIFAP